MTSAAALTALSGDLFDPDAFSDADILTLMTDLGITDAEVAVSVAARFDALPTEQVATPAFIKSHRRHLLAVLPGWLPVRPRTPSFSFLPTDLDLDGTSDAFPGMLPRLAPWWDAALGWAAFSGTQKQHGDAADWYTLAPADGWLAYAAGLSLDEYRASAARPTTDALWTLAALRAEDPEPVGPERAARRVTAARAAFVVFGGDPNTVTTL